jgi:hypothetical protein
MLLALPVGARAAEVCRPDCTHETKVCVCALDGRDITFTALGGVERQALRLRQALDPGDEIASTDQNAIVALTCPKSSSVNLHGRFRTIIMPPAQGQDCALNLLAGGADVQTDNPTQLSAGTTLMGSKRTTYAMRLSSDATVACMVFEGEVQIQNLATGAAARSLGPLASASWRAGALQQFGAPIPQADLATTARVYARAETARARALGVPLSNPAGWQRELEARHAAVLARPQDPLPRIDLAGVQTRVRLTAPALYQLGLAERLNPSRPEQAAIAATRWVAYRQAGREQEAAGEAERLRTLDPERYKAIQKIEAGVAVVDRRQPLVTAEATPAVVGSGERTTIAVTVKALDGQPIGGADVILSAGGGSFAGSGRPRIEGRTDIDGVFRAEWQCQPCASGYQIAIEVTGARLSPHKTILGIRTR